MVGQLTTHVLDTAQGRPAANMAIQLWRIDIIHGGRHLWIHLKTLYTTANGRTEEPLLAGEEMIAGVYELHFALGPYFKQQAIVTSEPPFLDEVPVRFGIADVHAHYHVPLLASPWAYSTYRGS